MGFLDLSAGVLYAALAFLFGLMAEQQGREYEMPTWRVLSVSAFVGIFWLPCLVVAALIWLYFRRLTTSHSLAVDREAKHEAGEGWRAIKVHMRH